MKSSLRYFIRLTQNNQFYYFTGTEFEAWAHPEIKHFTTEAKAVAAAQAAQLTLTPYDPARGTLIEGEICVLLLIPHTPSK